MSEPESEKASLLARVKFPIYCIKAISERHILIGGGGGISKTGVQNAFEIYELIYDPQTNIARASLVTHFDVGGHAIMNMCVIPSNDYLCDIPCGGLQGMCHVYEVRLKFKNGFTDHQFSRRDSNRSVNDFNPGGGGNLRRRHFSLSSQHSVEDIEENIEELNESELGQNSIKNKPHSDGKKSEDHKKNSIPNSNNSSNSTILDYTFEFDLKKSFQTDFHANEPYQKLVKYSASVNMIFSAGADGHIGFWQLSKYKLLVRIKAHENEIDDLCIHPTGKHLVSVSRDGKGRVWNVSSGKLVTSLEHGEVIPKPKNDQSSKAKYFPRLCRYSTVEGDESNVRLFVALNAQAKCDSYICKWFVRNDEYVVEKIVNVGDVPLFALAINDNGRFLAVGKQTGDVDVYIAFSLQRCYRFSQAHNIFVTGLEFLPTTSATMELVGGQVDAALVSVSVDNRIVLHKIPKRATLGFFGSLLFFISFILVIYVTMNYFDL